jgi:3-keto-disaccharide hydrolase
MKNDFVLRQFSFATVVLALVILAVGSSMAVADHPKVSIDASGPGWVAMGEDDFRSVNSSPDTWSFKDDMIFCTGEPVSVMRTKKSFKNFELVCQWRHRKYAGNSGIFVWVVESSLDKLAKEGKPGLPSGVEVQILDLGYKTNYEKNGKKATWFTCHGDIFPVGSTKMELFAPLSPSGSRSFPSKNLSKGFDQWNHYYVRCINGEIRLWVNGEEVSGGNNCQPSSGPFCLESEGSPVEFKGLKVRVLP